VKKLRILTEKLRGEGGDGKLAILDSSVSLRALRKARERIITARLDKPLFNEKWTQKELEELIQIWELVR